MLVDQVRLMEVSWMGKGEGQIGMGTPDKCPRSLFEGKLTFLWMKEMKNKHFP